MLSFPRLVGGSEVWGSPSRAREGSAEASSLPSVSVPACVLRVPLPTSSSGTRALSFPPSPSPPFPMSAAWAGGSRECFQVSPWLQAAGTLRPQQHLRPQGGGGGVCVWGGSRWSRQGLEASTRPGRQGSGAGAGGPGSPWGRGSLFPPWISLPHRGCKDEKQEGCPRSTTPATKAFRMCSSVSRRGHTHSCLSAQHPAPSTTMSPGPSR